MDIVLDVTKFAGFGSSGGPGHSTAATRSGGGGVNRVARWDAALRNYSLSVQTTDPVQVSAVRRHLLAMRGSLTPFLILDPDDHATNATDERIHKVGQGTPETALDMALPVAGDGTTRSFQLVRSYESGGGAASVSRNIIKPIPSTVLIAVNGVVVPTTDYTVNGSTGVVTFNVGAEPANLAAITWGGQYYTPVFFGLELDDGLQVVQRAYDNTQIASLPLEEERSAEAVRDAAFRGGSNPNQNITAGQIVTISTLDGTFHSYSPADGVAFGVLPDPVNTPDGGSILTVTNQGAFDFKVYNKDGVDDPTDNNLVQTIPIGQTFIFHLAKATNGSGTWFTQGT